MQKDLLKSQKLKSEIKNFKTESIFDIVAYGSVVRGKEKANDLDIAIILNKKEKLNEKLKMAAKLKDGLDFLEIDVDVKTIDILDLLDPTFIARQAILTEGYSLLNRKFLHESFGFNAFTIFTYDLQNLTESQKKMLYYALKGRRGQKGMLKLKGGEQLSNCMIKVPIQHSEEFKSLMKKLKFNYETILTYKF